MSRDRVTGHPHDDADVVLTQLRSFGETFDATLDEVERQRPIERPWGADRPSPPGDSMRRRAVQLALVAAALLTVALGVTLVLRASDQQSVESVDSPDQLSDPAPVTSTTVAEGAVAWPGPAAGRSVLLAADGSMLAHYEPLDAYQPGDGDEGGTTWADVASTLDEGQSPTAGGFVDEVLRELEELTSGTPAGRGAPLTAGGLRIHTSYSPEAQTAAAETVAARSMPESDGFDLALVTLDNRTGAVRSIVGRGDDRAGTVAMAGLVQPGSAFRPVVLTAALGEGWTPADEVRSDSPCRFDLGTDVSALDEWLVRGGDDRPGTRTLAEAVRSDHDCAIVRIGFGVGSMAVARWAEQLGIDVAPDQAQIAPTIALGVYELSPVDLATAYATLASEGERNDPWMVERIETADGEVIYERTDGGQQVLDVEVARQVTDVLIDQIDSGEATAAALSGGHEAAGQPGLSEDGSAAWFVGSTSYVTTAIWIGDADERRVITLDETFPLGPVGLAAEIWAAYNDRLHADLPPQPFPEPQSYDGGRLLTAPEELD